MVSGGRGYVAIVDSLFLTSVRRDGARRGLGVGRRDVAGGNSMAHARVDGRPMLPATDLGRISRVIHRT